MSVAGQQINKPACSTTTKKNWSHKANTKAMYKEG